MFRVKFPNAFAAAASRNLAGAQMRAEASSKSDWQLSAGAALIAAPRSIGSDKTRYLAVPTFDICYQDWFFVDPIKSIGLQAKPADGLTVSAALGISLDSRRAKDERRYQRLGDIKEAPALIFGLDYELGDAFVSTSLKTRLGSGTRRGTTVDVDLDYNVIATRAALVPIGASAHQRMPWTARTRTISWASSPRSQLLRACRHSTPAVASNAQACSPKSSIACRTTGLLSAAWKVRNRVVMRAAVRSWTARCQTTFIFNALKAF